jgi:hypothetical protein
MDLLSPIAMINESKILGGPLLNDDSIGPGQQDPASPKVRDD